MQRTIMIDFDGTITKQDTCMAVANKFCTGDWTKIDKQWYTGELTTKICSEKIFELMDFDEKSLTSFLETIEIDDYFCEFVKFCTQRNYGVCIVSDGFDFNINTVLGKYGIDDLEIYSNVFFFDAQGKYSIGFPHQHHSCQRCGTCKTRIYDRLKETSDEIIYIGDGYSDKCVAENVDILFAKGYLAQYCEKKGIEYIKYDTFKDIMNYLLHISQVNFS